MPVLRTVRGLSVCIAHAMLMCAAFVPAVRGQELPLRRDIADPVPFTCAAVAPASSAPTASEESREEATRLSAAATNALILGDNQTARDRLVQASSLDPNDPGIAFRLARTLQELNDPARAAREYCRYLRLAPDAPDSFDVNEVITAIAPPHRPGIPDSAVAWFRDALVLADSGRYAAADSVLTAVVDSAPSWSAAFHNRGVIRAHMRRRNPARADLYRSLEIEPAGPMHTRVRDWIAQLDARDLPYSVGGAVALGVIPGAGHFYTGRPIPGLLFLAGAGGAAAAGYLIQEKHIECLAPLQNNTCPQGQVRREWIERPQMMIGVGAAAAITILGAIDAARGASRKNSLAPIIRFSVNDSDSSTRLVMPDIRPRGSGLDIALLRLEFQD